MSVTNVCCVVCVSVNRKLTFSGKPLLLRSYAI